MNISRTNALLISASDFDNDSRLQRFYKRLSKAGFETSIVAYGSNNTKPDHNLSPIPTRSFFARLFDVAKMIGSRVLSERQLLKMLSGRLITKDLTENGFQLAEQKAINLVAVKHWASLPTALLLKGKPKIWLDINEVFEAEHDNSKLWQLIYKPVILRLLKIADDQIILRSATSFEQIKYMGDDTILHLPNTKKPIEEKPSDHIYENPIKLLYHGLITTNRSLETSIDALQRSGRKDLDLTIRGHGKPSYIKKLKSRVDNYGLSKQISFEPSVKNSELIKTASQYDVGLCLFANHSMQLMLAEPNKIYEYMAAGLGIIASQTPTMERMVKNENLGELTEISSNQTNQLEKVFSGLTHEKIKLWKENSLMQARKTWQENYDWPKLDSYLDKIQLETNG